MLGILVGLYAIYSAVTGKVYAKSGPGGRTVSRTETPEYFWVVIVVYACLSAALLLYF
ncbi:MAG TPA: hypothetical protein VE175_15705 [Woeseiaceae bacterium]|jgi:hypothetical protein|nr:hypothetical protein [Woeseiaceae bacterium]